MAIGCVAPIISMVQFCVFLHRLSARNSAVFRVIVSTKIHRHSPALRGSGAPKEATTDSWIVPQHHIGTITWFTFWVETPIDVGEGLGLSCHGLMVGALFQALMESSTNDERGAKN